QDAPPARRGGAAPARGDRRAAGSATATGAHRATLPARARARPGPGLRNGGRGGAVRPPARARAPAPPRRIRRAPGRGRVPRRPRPAPPGPGPGHRHGLRGARPRRSEAGTRGRRHGHTQHRTDPESMTPEILAEKLARVREEVAARVVGQDEVIDQALVTFLARRHALLEGVPGNAKTLLVRVLASALDTRFARIQFTPDLMPADVTGTTVLRDGGRTTESRPGPIFTDLLLADEINRAPAKTQAALLEAMQERQVTVDGESRP